MRKEARVKWLKRSADAGLQHRALAVVVVDACHAAFAVGSVRTHEAEVVLATYLQERRDVERYWRIELRAPAGLVKQITMALAKGVVNLDHDGAQRAAIVLLLAVDGRTRNSLA